MELFSSEYNASQILEECKLDSKFCHPRLAASSPKIAHLTIQNTNSHRLVSRVSSLVNILPFLHTELISQNFTALGDNRFQLVCCARIGEMRNIQIF